MRTLRILISRSQSGLRKIRTGNFKKQVTTADGKAQSAVESVALADNAESVFSESWAVDELEEAQSLHEDPDPDADVSKDQEMNDSEPFQTSDSRAWETSSGCTSFGRSFQTQEDWSMREEPEAFGSLGRQD